MAFDFKKEYKLLYNQRQEPQIIEVPAINYLSVSGKGNPNEIDGAYQKAIGMLYAVAYTLKMSYKTDYQIEGFYDYVVPPLEGFWWMEDSVADYSDKSAFNWISVIRLPDFVMEKDVAWAIEAAEKKKKMECHLVEMMTFEEGVCVQMMHRGSFDDEIKTIMAMETYVSEAGYVIEINEKRRHHEIYLSDARKMPPEKWKTIIRQPIRKIR